MCAQERKRVLTPSTAEAIRMASASILGSTTARGIPLGSAFGTGSVLEDNSESVAMNVTPLVLSVRDALWSSEGLDLLSVEWDLERAAGSEVLPEQLAVASSADGTGGSHVCVLSWEKGVIDPFKAGDSIRSISKKLLDIEKAATNSGLDYETHCIPVMRRFSDRLNRVFFVDMMDRRFQASWDSFYLKPEHVDVESVVVEKCKDDFTRVPPGLRVTKRIKKEFLLPKADDSTLAKHFESRVMTPRGLETLCVRVPELGQAILSELNTYAYSREEAAIVTRLAGLLVKHIGADVVQVKNLDAMRSKLDVFIGELQKAVSEISLSLDAHVRSGKALPLSGHKAAILETPEVHALKGLALDISRQLVDGMIESLGQEFPHDEDVRAWQLRSAISYFVAYCRRVSQYFARETEQYLMISSARVALSEAVHSFRQRMTQETTEPLDLMLFQKLYAELYSQMNAAFDRITYRQTVAKNVTELMDAIIHENEEFLRSTDMWDLISFGDVAQIVRAEIRAKYSAGEGLDAHGQALEVILTSMERLVAESAPDIAETILSRAFMRELVPRMLAGRSPADEILELALSRMERPDDWRSELRLWMGEYRSMNREARDLRSKLLGLINLVHDKVSGGLSAHSMVDRISQEVASMQNVYDGLVSEWEQQRQEIEAQNVPMIAHNDERSRMIEAAKLAYQNDTAAYESALAAYKGSIQPDSVAPTAPLQMPQSPEPMDERLRRIDAEFPLKPLIRLPEKPEMPQEFINRRELDGLLRDRMAKMSERQEGMERKFSEHLESLRDQISETASRVSVSMTTDFVDYLMDSVVRSLGRLLPRVTRAILRDPANPKLLYLVTYDHQGDEITVRIGDNLLR